MAESEEENIWRCMYCGDRLVDDNPCNKQECIDKYNASCKRMGINSFRVKDPTRA